PDGRPNTHDPSRERGRRDGHQPPHVAVDVVTKLINKHHTRARKRPTLVLALLGLDEHIQHINAHNRPKTRDHRIREHSLHPHPQNRPTTSNQYAKKPTTTAPATARPGRR